MTIRKKHRKGFTLIEIMVVVLIIAMLGAFVAPKVFKRFGKAKYNLAVAGVALVEKTLEDFAYDCERYPTQEEGLGALLVAPADLPEGKWDGPYLKEKQLSDPWGNKYLYVVEDAAANTFAILSYGADGAEGGEGENADISSK
jgi:general secretion pathway protein G